MSKREIIGKYIVSESYVDHNASYENASWWQDVEIDAGAYDIWADVKENGEVEDNSISIRLAGTIVDENFAGTFYGVRISNKPYESRSKGLSTTVVRSPYAHAVAGGMLGAHSWMTEYVKAIKLTGFEPVEVKYNWIRNGEPGVGTTYAIRRAAAPVEPVAEPEATPATEIAVGSRVIAERRGVQFAGIVERFQLARSGALAIVRPLSGSVSYGVPVGALRTA